MKKAILGKKIGMTQVFTEDGQLIPVSVIQAGPCQVVQKKTEEVDGYTAVQVGYEDKKERRANKPEKGHFQKANVPVKKYLKEFKLDNAAELNVGDELTVERRRFGRYRNKQRSWFRRYNQEMGNTQRSYDSRFTLSQRPWFIGRMF